MVDRLENRRYLLWLALGTGCLAIAMAVLLMLQLTQNRSIRASSERQVDSITALTFQLEREFLRMRQTLDSAVNSPTPPDADTLNLRHDIFVSRVQLLRDTPSTTLLRSTGNTPWFCPNSTPLRPEAIPCSAKRSSSARSWRCCCRTTTRSGRTCRR